MKKVWNITDHPESKVPARALMLFGKKVLPGRYVKVEDAQLKNAHKIQKDVAAGLVFIGNKLPASYASMRPVRAKLPKGHARAHGEQATPVKAAAPKIKKLVTEKPAPPKEEEKVSEGKAKKTGK